MDSLVKLFWIARPISWPNTAFPFAAGWLVSGGSFGWFFVIGTLFFLIPYNLLMYGINDVFDYESDINNPRKGGIEGMREQRAFHPTIVKASIGLTIPFVVYLLIQGNLVQNLTFIALVFFVLSYSLVGLRFKEIPLLDSLNSSIHFVGPLIYALTFTSFAAPAPLIIIAFLLWGIASHALGAIQDIIPDRVGKISSIATVFGARITLVLVAVMYTASAVIIMTLASPFWLVGVLLLLYVANLYQIRGVNDQSSAKANKPWRRFIWLNLFVGFITTLLLITTSL